MLYNVITLYDKYRGKNKKVNAFDKIWHKKNGLCHILYRIRSFSIFYGLNILKQVTEIKGRKIILRCLCPSDHLHGTILFQEQFSRAQLSVVVVTHRKTMCAGIMDDKDIAHIDLRKHPVNRKFIIVLAQGTGYIELVVARHVL